jgi:hypothetical protein
LGKKEGALGPPLNPPLVVISRNYQKKYMPFLGFGEGVHVLAFYGLLDYATNSNFMPIDR